MIAQFIDRIFKTRNGAHLQHWQTNSFSEHDALGDFYEELIPMMDRFIECRMGLMGVVDGGGDKFKGSAIKALQSDLKWLAENRTQICAQIPALENILDEINGLYARTLFKLERLK